MDLKRPNDDFLGTDAKRIRTEAAPSKVLYFRNLTPDTTEADLTQFCAPFGKPVAVLKLKEKNQAFVEMDSVQTASILLNFFNAGNQAVIRNQAIDIQFSSRQTVTVSENRPSVRAQEMGEEVQGSIIHITVSNRTHPVDCDVLYHIFSQYGGTILKIVCFEKVGVQHALIEYSDPNAALVAKSVLNNHNIYNDGCNLKIEFSRLTRVNVRADDKNSRDFTQGGIAGGFGTPMGIPAVVPAAAGMASIQHSASPVSLPNPGRSTATHGSAASSKVLLVNNLNQERVTCDALFKLFGTCGDVMKVKILYHKRDMAFIQFRDATHALQALTHLKEAVLFDMKVNVQVSKMQDVPMPQPQSAESYEGLTTDYTNSNLHRFALARSKNANNITFPSHSLHLSNIPDGVDEAQVMQLFSMFGQVESFKFFVNSRKMGVVRFSTPAMAINALVALHGEPLEQYGFHTGDARGLVISFSKSDN